MYKLIVVVGIHEKVTVLSKDVGCAHIHFWQENIGWIANFKNFFGVVVEIPACLVTQVTVGITITNNLYRVFHANCSVVGCYD